MSGSKPGIDLFKISKQLRLQLDAKQAELAWNAITSVNDRLLFAYNHLQNLREIAHERITAALRSLGYWEYAFAESDEEQVFSADMYEIRRHALECIQHMHAIGDTLAHAIYQCSALPKLSPIVPRDITLWKVRATLQTSSRLCEPLDALAADQAFQYVSDACNHAKHQSIVKPTLRAPDEMNESMVDAKKLILFPSIERRVSGRQTAPTYHPEIPLIPFIEQELPRIWGIYERFLSIVEDELQGSPASSPHAA